MKLICIDDNDNGWSFCRLTNNKVYDTCNESDDQTYTIIDDSGKVRNYVRERFILLSDFRNEQIINILS